MMTSWHGKPTTNKPSKLHYQSCTKPNFKAFWLPNLIVFQWKKLSQTYSKHMVKYQFTYLYVQFNYLTVYSYFPYGPSIFGTIFFIEKLSTLVVKISYQCWFSTWLITGPSCWEFTSDQWILLIKGQKRRSEGFVHIPYKLLYSQVASSLRHPDACVKSL